MRFNNKAVHVANLRCEFDARQIEAEPMMFKGDWRGRHSGPITHAFLDKVEERWGSLEGVLFDSRAHMLMPGMYPCIPGWHTDETPRPDYLNGQPDLTCADFQAQHMLCVVDAGTGSLTEFVAGPMVLDVSGIENTARNTASNIYKVADRVITSMRPDVAPVASGEVVEFDCFSWHRGMPALGRGWRFFIRATRGSQRKALNKRRTQVQVYMPDLTVGW